jgi:hypothetical protein
MIQFGIPISLIGLGIAIFSWQKSKRQQFYSNTPGLIPLGVFVWGDGLVLGPFWFLSGIVMMMLSPLNCLRYYALFFMVRSMYEVVYWLNHQATRSDYTPPLPSYLSWLQPNEAAIVYQLINTCWAIASAAILLGSFVLG